MKKLILFCFLLNALGIFAQRKDEIKVEINHTNEIIVARNGTGNFRNIQQAIDSVRAFDPNGQTTIFIKNGIYKEKLILHSYLTNVRIIGENRDKTIINFDDHANINNMGTFKTYTFLIRGNDIIVENITIENSADQLGQAVAIHVEGDRIIFRNCRFLGNQDTIYAGNAGSRLYFENCYIEGTTDFIFGPSTSWFENCEIHCKKNSYITAANTPENIPYGYIFNNCRITLAPQATSVYLGRPWRQHAMTLYMNTNLPDGINPAGWDNWRNPDNEKTARYMEYNNTGKGANTSKRVKWSRILSDNEAKEFTVENVLKGCDEWNPMMAN